MGDWPAIQPIAVYALLRRKFIFACVNRSLASISHKLIKVTRDKSHSTVNDNILISRSEITTAVSVRSVLLSDRVKRLCCFFDIDKIISHSKRVYVIILE